MFIEVGVIVFIIFAALLVYPDIKAKGAQEALSELELDGKIDAWTRKNYENRSKRALEARAELRRERANRDNSQNL